MSLAPVGDKRPGNAGRPADGAPETRERPADQADAEKFGSLVKDGAKRQDAGRESGGGGGQQQNQNPAGGMADLFGQAVSSMLGPPPAGPMPAVPAVPAPAVASVQTPQAIAHSRCEELVERILVSQPAADGSAEVRIRIDKPWLPDTEIRLVKTPDAGLTVEFMADDVDAQRFLMPNLGELRGRLAERTGDQVTVRMTEQVTAQGDAGQPGDGRSRNRRNLYEEMGDNA